MAKQVADPVALVRAKHERGEALDKADAVTLFARLDQQDVVLHDLDQQLTVTLREKAEQSKSLAAAQIQAAEAAVKMAAYDERMAQLAVKHPVYAPSVTNGQATSRYAAAREGRRLRAEHDAKEPAPQPPDVAAGSK